MKILMEAYDAGLRDRAIHEKLPGRSLLSVEEMANLYRIEGPSVSNHKTTRAWTPDGTDEHPLTFFRGAH